MTEEIQEGDRVWWVEDTVYENPSAECKDCIFSPYEIPIYPKLRTGIYESYDGKHNCENIRLDNGDFAFRKPNDIYLDPKGAIEQFIEGLQEDFNEQLNEMRKQLKESGNGT